MKKYLLLVSLVVFVAPLELQALSPKLDMVQYQCGSFESHHYCSDIGTTSIELFCSKNIEEISSIADTVQRWKLIQPKIPYGIPYYANIRVLELQPIYRPLFALKTNLLYDAFTAINIEIEVPIGQRWSIAGEYIFPWWLSTKKQRCLQSLSGYIEGRYWFGDRWQYRQLTGWFMGLYAGGGYYDVEWDKKGYQGEFIVPVAVSAGYAHIIGRNLSMEYSIGMGYMRTRYSNYNSKNCPDGELRLIREKKGTYNWVGPTKVKVSLVWLINKKEY